MNIIKKTNGQQLWIPDLTSQPPTIKIINGRVIDPINGIDEVLTLCVKNGTILSLGKDAPPDFIAEVTIDAANHWVVPGLIDMHVHLREPGREDKETIATGAQAAAAGGFTAVACMPNTTPTTDNADKINYCINRSIGCACRVYPIGAITSNLAGNELTPFAEMKKAGARGLSNDGKSVYRSGIMRDALRLAKSLDIPVLCHCEDADLVAGGAINEGAASRRLGVGGIAAVSEDLIVARDIMLAEYTGAAVHICHVSTAGAVGYIRWAKSRGVNVTAETGPHYTIFTDSDITAGETHKKMNPPLRSAVDRAAVIAGLIDGTIDCIASDHAPHTAEEKNAPLDKAPFGIVGLETSLGAVLTYLLHTNTISAQKLVYLMSVMPSRILKVDGGHLSTGAVADITIIDPQAEWTVDSTCFYSKSANTPFNGMRFKGFARTTILGGRLVYQRT